MQRDGVVLNMVLRIFLGVIAQSLQTHAPGAANVDTAALHIGAVRSRSSTQFARQVCLFAATTATVQRSASAYIIVAAFRMWRQFGRWAG
jgi:hypothetical protein